jgi:hypothetical protein
MFRCQGMVTVALVLGGVDVTRPHLHVVNINHAPIFKFSLHSKW